MVSLTARSLPGHRGRGEDHRVALVEAHARVVVVGHAPQGGERLALGPGGDDHDALVGEVVDLPRLDQHPLRDLDVPELAADVHVLAHRAPDERDLAVERGGRVDHLLDAVDVRGEARHDDAPVAAGEDLLEVRPDPRLARREPGPVGVRRVAAQQQQAVAAELGEPRDVGRPAVHRRLVELVVAGDEHGAELRGHRDGAGVRDRVRHVDELDLEGPERHALPRVEVLERDVAKAVLVELGAGHRHRQRAAVDDRHVLLPELAQHPRQRAEMVLVAVGDDDRLDVVHAVAQIGEVGQDEVDAEHLRGREAQADVDDDDAAVVLDDRHVLADLPQPSEREDAQRAAHARAAFSSPCRSRAARTASASSSLASTSGRRSPPTSRPSRLSAHFTGIGFVVTPSTA